MDTQTQGQGLKPSMEGRDGSELDDRFTPYYESGERVEVVWKPGCGDFTGYGYRTGGKRARFYVGRSTGRRPIYLMIYQRNSIGGQAILSSVVESVTGLGIYKSGCWPMHGYRRRG